MIIKDGINGIFIIQVSFDIIDKSSIRQSIYLGKINLSPVSSPVFGYLDQSVIGSGIMGSGIACHLANIGLEVLLLDISPNALNDEEKTKGLTLEHPLVKNRIVKHSFENAKKSKPSPLYHPSFAKRVSLGNLDSDLPKIKDADWIIEVVVEESISCSQIEDDACI